MRVNLVFHDIAENHKELKNKYSLHIGYFLDLIKELDQIVTKPQADTRFTLYFDDGYQSLYEQVLPLRRQIKFPITAAIITDKINMNAYITLDQLKDIYSKKIQIASHGVSHAALAVYKNNKLQNTPKGGVYENSPFGQGEPLTEKEIKYQFIESKKRLQLLINTEVTEFVLPYGLYNPTVVDLFKSENIYSFLSTCDIGADNGQMLRPRFLISNDHPVKETISNISTLTNHEI